MVLNIDNKITVYEISFVLLNPILDSSTFSTNVRNFSTFRSLLYNCYFYVTICHRKEDFYIVIEMP